MPFEIFTNAQLFGLQEPLKELAKVDVPAKVGIRIARLIRLIQREVEPINDVRNKLIGKYGEKGVVNAESPNWEKFVQEHSELMRDTRKVEFEKVVLPDEVRVGVDTLVALEPFLAVADIPGVPPNGVAADIRALVQ